MKYSGSYGEHRVLACLLEKNIEAYLAIKTNQKDYDITAILNDSKIIRIQVKTTQLNNKNTNNSIDGIDKHYDYLVIVVIDDKTNTSFFILTKEEAIKVKGKAKQLGISYQKGVKQIKESILIFKDCWDKIS